MSQRFIRCAHCGLPHEGHVTVCPTTGLRIERMYGMAQRRRKEQRQRDESPERMIGWVLDGKYRLTAVLGQGGMSAIYEAEQFGLARPVAVKVLHPVLADDPDAIARLRNEAQVVSTIGHPNICEVLDLGRTPDGIPYLVMERLFGESLAERIKRGGPMGFGEIAPLLVQVLAALDAAHHHGILHRDLKPENVFIEQRRGSGRTIAKLLDFGISKSMGYDFVEQARLTHTGMVMGTPYYMAPEQARGDSALDQRVDLWAVGVILYEALTARRPFVATNYNALLVKILTSRPRPVQKIEPSIPAPVSALVDRALSKLREDRFQSAYEFGEAIRRVERACAVDDGHLATPVLRRSRPSRDWNAVIDDPETFIDDASVAAYEDHPPEPLEPTIHERMRELEYDEPRDTWQPPPDPSDTDVMRRSELELAARRATGLDDDSEAQNDTEVIQRRRLVEERTVADRAIPGDSGRDTLPPSESQPEAWSEGVPAEETMPASDPGLDDEEPAPRRRTTLYPESERTMFYDIDKANEQLRARRLRSGAKGDSDDGEG